MKEEAGGIIKDNTEARIGMDHDTMSITLSPRFSMKICYGVETQRQRKDQG